MISKKPSVLIVDDEEAVCQLLYEELSERGYLCSVALDGEEALIKLASEHFEVALLDVRLPRISGMDLLAKIRSSYPETFAIMVTAVTEVHTAVKAMKLGAADYVVKPFDVEMLDTIIRRVLQTEMYPLERAHYRVPLRAGDEKREQALEAIASGVKARYDLALRYSEMVTQETIEIARQLGIDDDEIERWAAATTMGHAERERVITSLLNKLKRSPLAQKMLGLSVPYLPSPKPTDSRN